MHTHDVGHAAVADAGGADEMASPADDRLREELRLRDQLLPADDRLPGPQGGRRGARQVRPEERPGSLGAQAHNTVQQGRAGEARRRRRDQGQRAPGELQGIETTRGAGDDAVG